MDVATLDVSARRARVQVLQGGAGPDLMFLHGAGGVLANDPLLNALTQHFRVHAPLLPGFGGSEGGEHLRTMLDFTLHADDVRAALGLERPVLVGHSMGGMIAAELAAVMPNEVERLALLAPAGLWLDAHPVTDLFTLLPFELPQVLLHDPERHGHLLAPGGDLNDPEFLTTFMVDNHRRLAMAGKLLFPVPDRGLAERLYRVRAKTLLLWGASDRMIPPVYAERFQDLLPNATLEVLDEAGHLMNLEQPQRTAEAINRHAAT